jgi:hypothetical protein
LGTLWETGCQEPYIDVQGFVVSVVPFLSTGANLNTIRVKFFPLLGFFTCDYLSRCAIYYINCAKPQENKTSQLTVHIHFKVGSGVSAILIA